MLCSVWVHPLYRYFLGVVLFLVPLWQVGRSSLMSSPVLRLLELNPVAWFSAVFCHHGPVRLIHACRPCSLHVCSGATCLSCIHLSTLAVNIVVLWDLIPESSFAILVSVDFSYERCGLLLYYICLSNFHILRVVDGGRGGAAMWAYIQYVRPDNWDGGYVWSVHCHSTLTADRPRRT
jgi:hypothetical protein